MIKKYCEKTTAAVTMTAPFPSRDIDGLVQDCSNSSVLAMELLQSCAKPLTLCTTTIMLSSHQKDKVKSFLCHPGVIIAPYVC